MIYLTGVHALNIEDSILCCGDWHTSAIQWSDLSKDIKESDDSIFKDYGIESDKTIPEHNEKYNVANTLRAVLDLLEGGHTRYLIGFRDDFIMVDDYNEEFFKKVILLRDNKYWSDIDDLMKKEFMFLWLNFKESYNGKLDDIT